MCFWGRGVTTALLSMTGDANFGRGWGESPLVLWQGSGSVQAEGGMGKGLLVTGCTVGSNG